MNIRERFLATMAFEHVDRAPLWEWDYWPDALQNWKASGAPMHDRIETVNLSPDQEGAFDPMSNTQIGRAHV